MAKLWVKTLNVSSNPSGAAAAARQGNVVMIVDVIDMSTTAEAALEAGAAAVLGASPDNNNIPVTVNPEKIGYFAGKKALKNETEVVISAEQDLLTSDNSRNKYSGFQLVAKGIDRAGAEIAAVKANIGKEFTELIDVNNKVVVIVSPTGGAAYDAAYNYGAPEVITGTIARTNNVFGDEPAAVAARRAISRARKYMCGITIVAASSHAMEDLLAADYISKRILNQGFLEKDNSSYS